MNNAKLDPNKNSAPYSTTPGFRWLGRTRVNLLVLIVISCLFWTTAFWLVGAFSGLFDDSAVLSIVFIALFAAAFGTWIHQVKGIHEDLNQLLETNNGDSYEDAFCQLNGSVKANRIINFCGVLIGLSLYIFGRAIGDPVGITNSIGLLFDRLILFQASLASILWDYLSLFLFTFIGIALAQGIASRSRQSRIFYDLAKSIPIDILNTNNLTRIANPLIRALVAPVGVLAASGPLLFAFDGNLVDTFYLISLPIVVFLLVLSLLSGRAVFVMHRRIHDEKVGELGIIHRYLNGDKQAMASSRLGGLQSQFDATDVLAYRDRIEEVWEWPLHGHLPRLIFYLTIPPMAWAAAALVERIIDVALT